jgi:hypothetical protein
MRSISDNVFKLCDASFNAAVAFCYAMDRKSPEAFFAAGTML